MPDNLVETVSSGGYANVLFMGGLISMGLALFNFLPIPPLDEGGMSIALIEGLRRGKQELSGHRQECPQKIMGATATVPSSGDL